MSKKMQLHMNGKPVEYVEGGHGIMIYGKTITGRKAIVSDHYVDPKLLVPGASFVTGGHHWEVKHHPSYYSLD